MLRPFFLLSLFSMITCHAHAQVVNIEDFRNRTDTTGWSGHASLFYDVQKAEESVTQLSNDVHVQFKTDRSLWLLLNDIEFLANGKKNLVDNGFQHLRYNVRLSELLRWEAFLQSQYNGVNDLLFRGLAGTGPRFKLTQSEVVRFYAAVLVMAEREHNRASKATTTARGSAYLSFTLEPGTVLRWVSTTYVQPRLDRFSDLRIASESVLSLKILRRLEYQVNFTLNYDSKPPIDIGKLQYHLKQGVTFTFLGPAK